MEVWWRFIWEPTPDMRGWFAWRKDPMMDKWVCIGTLSDERVLHVLNSQPPSLTLDDSIDFHLWMRNNGWKEEQEDNIDDSAQESETQKSTNSKGP
jgi:hypothetical protein